MTKAIAHTLHTAHNYRLHISYFLIGVCAFLIALYCVNVYSIVSKTAELNTVKTQTLAKESSLKGLDAEYLKISSNIKADTLGRLGMTQGKVTAFINRSTVLGTVAIGGYDN